MICRVPLNEKYFMILFMDNFSGGVVVVEGKKALNK